MIKGAKAFAKSKKLSDLKISALSDLTLKIETEYPTGLLIHLLAVPDVGVLKIDDPAKEISFDSKTAFSGPYKITSLGREKLEILKWRESDLDSSNPPQEIEFNLFEKIDPNQVASGKITDTSSFMTFDEEKSPLESNGDWRDVASEAANERYILMNPSKLSKEVRRWMLAQVNTEDFVATLNDNSIVPAYGFVPNCLPGHLKMALKHKRVALSLDKSIVIKVSYGANLPYAEKFKSYLSKVWAHQKLKLEFEALPVSAYLNILFKKKGEVVIGARGMDYPEAYSVVTYFRSNIESNYFFVNNKSVDALIDKAAQELDAEARYKIYETIQERVLEGATVIPLAFGAWKKYYWFKRVLEVPPHPIGVQFMPFEMLVMAEN